MDEQYETKLLMKQFVTHDVMRFLVSKPTEFSFQPGQAVELAINNLKWKSETRPFTPSGYVDDEVIEFTIKQYPDHDGVTHQLHQLKTGTELIMSEPFGTISYKGPGVFIAGGAGITPFLAIMRDRIRHDDLGESVLMFSNKTPADIICEKELRSYFKGRCAFICTKGKFNGYEHQRIDKDFLKEQINNFDQPFYVCGPPGFMDAINGSLKELGVDSESLVFEE